MKGIKRIILVSLVIIHSFGYDWLHTFWHYRNGPRSILVSLRSGLEPDTPGLSAIRNGQTVIFNLIESCILAVENEDRLVNTSQPFQKDWSAADFPHCPDVRIAEYAIRRTEWVNPDIPGFHFAVFRPPRIVVSVV